MQTQFNIVTWDVLQHSDEMRHANAGGSPLDLRISHEHNRCVDEIFYPRSSDTAQGIICFIADIDLAVDSSLKSLDRGFCESLANIIESYDIESTHLNEVTHPWRELSKYFCGLSGQTR